MTMGILWFLLGFLSCLWITAYYVRSMETKLRLYHDKARHTLDDAYKETRHLANQVDWFKRNSIREANAITNLKKLNKDLVKENSSLKVARYNRTRRK